VEYALVANSMVEEKSHSSMREDDRRRVWRALKAEKVARSTRVAEQLDTLTGLQIRISVLVLVLGLVFSRRVLPWTQQQQAGDSSVVQRRWGETFDEQTALHGREADYGGLSEGCRCGSLRDRDDDYRCLASRLGFPAAWLAWKGRSIR
jgi:hypothetical protein